MWHKNEERRLVEYDNLEIERRLNEARAFKINVLNPPKKKEILMYDPVRDATLNHMLELISSGTVKAQCERAMLDNNAREMPKIKQCFKEKRKAAVFKYTRFSSP